MIFVDRMKGKMLPTVNYYSCWVNFHIECDRDGGYGDMYSYVGSCRIQGQAVRRTLLASASKLDGSVEKPFAKGRHDGKHARG
jgi:hypothetical protein